MWFRERSVEGFRWLVGPSATPPGVVAALVELGARQDEEEPELTALVLDRAPLRAPDVPVRQVSSRSDFAHMERIRREVFAPESTASSEDIDAGWAALSSSVRSKAFLVEDDGEAVVYGVMRQTDAGPWLLAGSVTLPQARGRGRIERWCACAGTPRKRWVRRRSLPRPRPRPVRSSSDSASGPQVRSRFSSIGLAT